MGLFNKIFLGTIVSFYFFPIGFTFLPPSINTKMLLAIFGCLVFLLDNFKLSELKFSYNLLVSTIIAVFFSVICLYAADFNHTNDYSYATYIISFFVWLGGAYAVAWFFRFFYGEFSFRQLSFYLIAVCVTQCFLSLVIDNFPAFKMIVDSIFLQGQEFLDKVDRLYGIGAALDNGGVRFSIVLIIAANLLIHDKAVKANTKQYFLILLSFFIIGIIGNMISRTTVIGVGIGFVYLIFYSDIFNKIIYYHSFKRALIFLIVVVSIVGFAVYIYNTSLEYRLSIRFAFEGFFNWYEVGEWRTSSTDKLNAEMWIWPTTREEWLIGTGIFGNFVYSTDIGYCRFILYCGLIGFSTFASLFIYNSLAFMFKVPQYRVLFLILGALSFIIWLKVATDIFFVFALFYCIDSFSTSEDTQQELEVLDENSI